MMRDRLQLESLLLSMVCCEDLVKDDNSAITVSRREYEALAIRRPKQRT